MKQHHTYCEFHSCLLVLTRSAFGDRHTFLYHSPCFLMLPQTATETVAETVVVQTRGSDRLLLLGGSHWSLYDV